MTRNYQYRGTRTDAGEIPPLCAYAFTAGGKLVGTAPVEKLSASFDVPGELDGSKLEIILGPRVEKGQPIPSAAGLFAGQLTPLQLSVTSALEIHPIHNSILREIQWKPFQITHVPCAENQMNVP